MSLEVETDEGMPMAVLARPGTTGAPFDDELKAFAKEVAESDSAKLPVPIKPVRYAEVCGVPAKRRGLIVQLGTDWQETKQRLLAAVASVLDSRQKRVDESLQNKEEGKQLCYFQGWALEFQLSSTDYAGYPAVRISERGCAVWVSESELAAIEAREAWHPPTAR